MAMPILSRAEVENMVLESLNISKTTYGTHDGSPLYKPEFVREMIFQADLQVVKAICRTPGHPRRNEYSTALTAISTPGVRVPLRDTREHFGEVVAVDITRADARVVVGKPAPAVKITEWLLDKSSHGGDDCVDGYYDITDNDFIFTGTSAVVRALTVPVHVLTPPDTNLYSPFEYKITVYHGAMVELLGKDPAMKDEVSKYAAAWSAEIAEIVGKSIEPSVEGYQKVR